MESVFLIIHLFLALAIIGLVLLQRSEGGGLGIGGGGMGNLASAQSTANILTRATAICATCFFATSLILGILAGTHTRGTSIIERLDETPPAVTAPVAGEESGTGAGAEEKQIPRPPPAPVAE